MSVTVSPASLFISLQMSDLYILVQWSNFCLSIVAISWVS